MFLLLHFLLLAAPAHSCATQMQENACLPVVCMFSACAGIRILLALVLCCAWFLQLGKGGLQVLYPLLLLSARGGTGKVALPPLFLLLKRPANQGGGGEKWWWWWWWLGVDREVKAYL